MPAALAVSDLQLFAQVWPASEGETVIPFLDQAPAPPDAAVRQYGKLNSRNGKQLNSLTTLNEDFFTVSHYNRPGLTPEEVIPLSRTSVPTGRATGKSRAGFELLDESRGKTMRYRILQMPYSRGVSRWRKPSVDCRAYQDMVIPRLYDNEIKLWSIVLQWPLWYNRLVLRDAAGTTLEYTKCRI